MMSAHKLLFILVTALFAGVSVLDVRASLWQGEDWALRGSTGVVAGYDSNLTVSHDGPADFFWQAEPSVTLLRRNSSTDFRLSCGAIHTDFVNGRLPAQTDWAIDAVCAYPNIENVMPAYKVESSWGRSFQPNRYLGKRIECDSRTAKAEVYQPVTGKLGIRGTAEYEATGFEESDLNDNSRGELLVGLGYKRTPRTEASLNASIASGRSRANDSSRVESNVNSVEYYVTLRMQGELTSKISGSIYAGVGRVDYSGGYENRNYLPVGGADLTWGIDPRRTLVLAVYSGARYTPDGTAVESTRVFLSFTHVIIGHWQYTLRAGPTFSAYSRQGRERTDQELDAGMEFAYKPSERFQVFFSADYSKQNSDADRYDFWRNVVSFGTLFHF